MRAHNSRETSEYFDAFPLLTEICSLLWCPADARWHFKFKVWDPVDDKSPSSRILQQHENDLILKTM